MVTFSCDNCNDTVKKPKANQHAQRCRGSLTCIDCSKTFWSGEWNAHNSCISEAEAYQGALYKPTKKELKRKAAETAAEQAKSTTIVTESPASAVVAPAEEVLPIASRGVKEVFADQKSKKQKKDKSESFSGSSSLAQLASVIQGDEPISIHKAIKLLRSQKNLDKDAEKSLLREILIKKNQDGTLTLV